MPIFILVLTAQSLVPSGSFALPLSYAASCPTRQGAQFVTRRERNQASLPASMRQAQQWPGTHKWALIWIEWGMGSTRINRSVQDAGHAPRSKMCSVHQDKSSQNWRKCLSLSSVWVRNFVPWNLVRLGSDGRLKKKWNKDSSHFSLLTCLSSQRPGATQQLEIPIKVGHPNL